MPGSGNPRQRSVGAQRERIRQDRLAQIMQHSVRALDGHADVLIIEFHHDDEQHVTVKTFARPLKGGSISAGGL